MKTIFLGLILAGLLVFGCTGSNQQTNGNQIKSGNNGNVAINSPTASTATPKATAPAGSTVTQNGGSANTQTATEEPVVVSPTSQAEVQINSDTSTLTGDAGNIDSTINDLSALLTAEGFN